ncbi:MAG TPA: hypothetical protein VFK21_01565 [Gammaproteobacteria bacterium]|nr:hypothetical protein [Gammaproteobacteria bacterium]
MRRLGIILLLTTGLAVSPAAFSACITGDALFAHPELKTQSAAFRDYEVRLYDDSQCEAEPLTPKAGFEIWKGGKRVASGTGYSYAIGYPLQEDQAADSVKLKIGDDLTGEGLPDLLLSEWSGGAHCCYTFHLFQLGTEFRKVQSLPLLDADESAFVRRPGVKGLVLASSDYSAFAYFPADFAGSPAGRVFLSYQQGRFRLDTALMRATAPRPGEIGRCAALFKRSRDWRTAQPMGMWYYATDLIYTGHEGDALSFLKESWGSSAAGRDRYLAEYQRRLRKSVYYPELRLLQSVGPSATDQKIDWTKQCFEYLHG